MSSIEGLASLLSNLLNSKQIPKSNALILSKAFGRAFLHVAINSSIYKHQLVACFAKLSIWVKVFYK
jgi:hypothetical protein